MLGSKYLLVSNYLLGSSTFLFFKFQSTSFYIQGNESRD